MEEADNKVKKYFLIINTFKVSYGGRKMPIKPKKQTKFQASQLWVKDLQRSIYKAQFGDVSAIYPNNGTESLEHLEAKCMAMKIILEKGNYGYSEVTLNGGRIDIVDSTEKIFIEFETELTDEIKKYKRERFDNELVGEIIFIDLKKLPEGRGERFEEIKRKINEVDSD